MIDLKSQRGVVNMALMLLVWLVIAWCVLALLFFFWD